MIKHLIENKSNLNSRDLYGQSSLDIAKKMENFFEKIEKNFRNFRNFKIKKDL